MSAPGGNSDSIRRYLLGELSGSELEQVEERLMSEKDLYAELLLAEDELIEEYLSDELTEEERARFRRHFLTVPELQQDVKFARALKKHAVEATPPVAQSIRHQSQVDRVSRFAWINTIFARPAFGAAAAAVLLLALGLSAALVWQNWRLRQQVDHLTRTLPSPGPPDPEKEVADLRRRNEDLANQVDRLTKLQEETMREMHSGTPEPLSYPPTPSAATSLFIVLISGLQRDTGQQQKITVLPEHREARIQLDLAADYPQYRATLKPVDGAEVWTSGTLRARGRKFLTITIPAKHIRPPNDYEILLNGITSSGESEEITRYYFRVQN